MNTAARRRLHDLIDALDEADLEVVAQALAALTHARVLPPVHGTGVGQPESHSHGRRPCRPLARRGRDDSGSGARAGGCPMTTPTGDGAPLPASTERMLRALRVVEARRGRADALHEAARRLLGDGEQSRVEAVLTSRRR